MCYDEDDDRRRERMPPYPRMDRMFHPPVAEIPKFVEPTTGEPDRGVDRLYQVTKNYLANRCYSQSLYLARKLFDWFSGQGYWPESFEPFRFDEDWPDRRSELYRLLVFVNSKWKNRNG